MCAVSNIGDMGAGYWPKPWTNDPPKPSPWDQGAISMPGLLPQYPYNSLPEYNGPTKAQFEEFLKLLHAAKAFDVATGQPDCKNDDKLDWIKAIAKHLGVPEPTL